MCRDAPGSHLPLFERLCVDAAPEVVMAALDSEYPPPRIQLDHGLALAVTANRLELVRLLFAKGGRITIYALNSLAEIHSPAMVQEFLNQGWNPDIDIDSDIKSGAHRGSSLLK